LIPREHGAYGQLLFPLTSALAIGRPGMAAAAWAAAAVCAFLAHEPLVVLLGQRGIRAAREDRARAWRWLGGCVAGAALCGAVSLAAMSTAARTAVLAPLGPGLVALALIAGGREHTVAGEVVSAAAISMLAWPAALAAGASPVAARSGALVFAAVFATTTIAVHGVIAHTRHPPAIGPRAAGAGAAMATLIAARLFVETGVLDPAAGPAVLPLCGAALGLAIAPPSARRLRTVGWVLVAGSAATTVLLVAGLR
jgi:hypothetical protein